MEQGRPQNPECHLPSFFLLMMFLIPDEDPGLLKRMRVAEVRPLHREQDPSPWVKSEDEEERSQPEPQNQQPEAQQEREQSKDQERPQRPGGELQLIWRSMIATLEDTWIFPLLTMQEEGRFLCELEESWRRLLATLTIILLTEQDPPPPPPPPWVMSEDKEERSQPEPQNPQPSSARKRTEH